MRGHGRCRHATSAVAFASLLAAAGCDLIGPTVCTMEATLEPVRGAVRVTEDECHVRTVEVVAEMRAAESS